MFKKKPKAPKPDESVSADAASDAPEEEKQPNADEIAAKAREEEEAKAEAANLEKRKLETEALEKKKAAEALEKEKAEKAAAAEAAAERERQRIAEEASKEKARIKAQEEAEAQAAAERARIKAEEAERDRLLEEKEARRNKKEENARRKLEQEQEEIERLKMSAPIPLGKNRRDLAAPPPVGVIGCEMEMARFFDMKVAFKMLDARGRGYLDRSGAQNFFRCAGWILSDEEIDEIVNTSLGIDPSDVCRQFQFDELCDVLETSRNSNENSTLDHLVQSLKRLAMHGDCIDRHTFEEICTDHPDIDVADVEEVIRNIGYADDSFLDVRDFLERLLAHVCDPERDRTTKDHKVFHFSAHVY